MKFTLLTGQLYIIDIPQLYITVTYNTRLCNLIIDLKSHLSCVILAGFITVHIILFPIISAGVCQHNWSHLSQDTFGTIPGTYGADFRL